MNNYLLGNNHIANQFIYDAHGNILSMPHLSAMRWSYKDELIGATNGTFTSYYNYDSGGSRTRKVVNKGNIIETRYYINGYEVFRKETNGVLDLERATLNISDDEKTFVQIDTLTVDNGQTLQNLQKTIRYQYNNHLGSACLELDKAGDIISYEEYHPFGTTSYRSGRDAIEVSLKRYKYCGKERDEETGLYYYGMRYYAAWLCRFISVDPLQFKYPHYTPYQYAGNKPITFIDLDGGEEKKAEIKKKTNITKATQKEIDRVNEKLKEKIKIPLKILKDQEASFIDIEATATSLAEKYQNKKWFRTFFSPDGTKTVIPRNKRQNEKTGWIAKDYITINPYSIQTNTYTSPVERPESKDMVNTGATNLIATPESSISITFSPFGVPNSIMVYSISTEGEHSEILKTDMFANDVLKENVTMAERDESVAGEIHYEVVNTLENKIIDNWKLEISVSTPVFDIQKEIRQPILIDNRPNLRAYKQR